MGFIIVFGLLILAGIIWHEIDAYNEGGMIMGVLGAIFLGIVLIALPFVRIGVEGDIREVKALERTIEFAREHDQKLENAAILMKVADTNEWIARVQFFKNEKTFWFGVFIPKEINELKPIS